MLKIWTDESKIPNDKLVNSPDTWYLDYQDEKLLTGDFAKKIIRDTSKIIEFLGINSFRTKFGYVISDDKLSEGCKMLLMMSSEECRNDNLVFNILFMGENCETYMEQMSEQYDINILLDRVYTPTIYSGRDFPKCGVMFMESGEIAYNVTEYTNLYHKYFKVFREA